MKLLFVSSLYPSHADPLRAPFNRALMRAIRGLGHTVEVVAPVPHFPLVDRVFRGRQLPHSREVLDGIPIRHPRVPYTPGLFIHRHHHFYRYWVRDLLGRQLAKGAARAGEADAVHAMVGFLYPDGVAVAALFRQWGVPYSVRVNGSDFRMRIQQRAFRPLVLRTLQEAPLIFCPGNALKRDIAAAGIDARKVVAFDNGVDPDVFHATSPDGQVDGACAASGEQYVLCVGNLLERKGPDRLLEAWALMLRARPSSGERLRLVFLGGGPLRGQLERSARRLHVRDTVQLLEPVPQAEVAAWMRGSACLCLPSSL